MTDVSGCLELMEGKEGVQRNEKEERHKETLGPCHEESKVAKDAWVRVEHREARETREERREREVVIDPKWREVSTALTGRLPASPTPP